MALLDEREGNEEEEEEEEDEEGREGGVSTQPLGCHWRTRPAPAATPREEGGSTSAIVDLLGINDKVTKSLIIDSGS
jgi:hypothetical protein